MSSIDSASMPGTEVSDKTVDFGAKAVSLKSQSDSTRLLQSSGQIRSVAAQGNIKSSLGVNTTPTPPVLSNISSQKTVVTRVTTSIIQTSVSTMGSLSRPSLPVTAVSSVSHVTTSYHVPRGAAQVSSIATRPSQGRSFVTLQPVGISSTSVTASKSSAQQIHRSSDTPRPLLLHATPQKPVTLTPSTQLHISADKTIKVPSVTQVLPLRPPYSTSSGFIGQPQGTTILSGVSSSPVLTTTVRLNVSQPPILSTQRVAMSGATGTVLASRITVPTASTGSTQAVAISGQPRIPSAINQGTVIASSSRIGGSVGVSQSTLNTPSQTRVMAGQNTIIAAPARLNTQVVSNQPTVSTTTARIASAGSTVLSTLKPPVTGSQAVMSTNRLTAIANHQPITTRIATSTTTTNLTRFTVPASAPNTRSTTSITSQITPTTTSRLTATTNQSTGIVVHPQAMLNISKSHGANHVTNARPIQIHNTGVGQKVITQALHGPIQITQSPINIATSKIVTQPSQNAVQSNLPTTLANKPTVCYTPVTSVASRPVAVVASQSIPITRVFSQNSGTTTTITDNEVTSAQTVQTPSSSVYIHRTLSSPGLICSSSSLASSNTPTLSTYTLPGGASYFYEAPSGYQLATDAPLVARPLSPDAPLVSRQLSSEGPLIARPFTPGNNAFVSQTSNTAGGIRSTVLPSHGLIATPQHMRFNSVMIVDQNAVSVQPSFSNDNSTLMIGESPLTSKLNSSPRPSILRKRDNETSPAKATKNLNPILSSASVSRSASPSPPSLHVDTNQQSNDHGPSSNGSTTISATSSPGPDDPGENMPSIKAEFNEDADRPPVEMSPRKKPRKQLLNDANDAIEMEFISDDRVKKEREEENGSVEKVYVVKRPNVSLLHSYKHNWKSRHNHFLRYSDVKPKDERRPTVTDLANQKQVVQKVNGWKIYHLSTQMEDLSEMESHVLDRLSAMLQVMNRTFCKEIDKDVNRVNDLIMGNIQRSKVIKDQMQEAKTQMMKVFDHKVHVSEIISRCASKRNFKKREKY